MMRREPPPAAFTREDAFHIAVGAGCILLGAIILLRTLPVMVAPPAVITGLGFIGFGLYRCLTAWRRYRWYRQIKGARKP